MLYDILYYYGYLCDLWEEEYLVNVLLFFLLCRGLLEEKWWDVQVVHSGSIGLIGWVCAVGKVGRSGSRRKLVVRYVSFNSTNLGSNKVTVHCCFTSSSSPLLKRSSDLMCGRAYVSTSAHTLYESQVKSIAKRRKDSAKTQFSPKFNEMQTLQKEGATATVVSPGQILPVLRTANSSSSSSSNSAPVFSLEPMIWGLIPSYVKNPSGAANEHFKVIYLWNLILMPM